MAHEVDPNACDRTPEAVRAALQRRRDWLQAFEQEWLSAAADFDQPALDAVIDKWFPFACACATPGYLDAVEHTVRRMAEDDTEGLVFRDAEGHAYDADGRSVDAGSRSVDAGSRSVDAGSRSVDADGRSVDADGRSVDAGGRR